MCLTYRKALINKKKIPTLEEEKNPVESDFHEDKKNGIVKNLMNKLLYSLYTRHFVFFVFLFPSKELLLLSASIQA